MAIQDKILKDLTKYIPQVILPTILAFVSVPIYTKLFDPSAYGNFYIAKAALNLLDRCSNWIGSALTRYYNEYDKFHKLKEMISSIIKTNIIFALLTTLPTLIILGFLPIDNQLKVLFQIGIILFAFVPTSNVLRNVLRMQRKIYLHSLFIISRSLFSFMFSLLLIYLFRMQMESIFLGELLIVAIILPILWKSAIGKQFSYKIPLNLNIIRQFFCYGAPLTFSIVGLWLLDFSDRYIIKFMLGSYAVGIYSACYNITWNSLFLLVHLFYMMEEPLAMKIYAHEGAEALKEFITCESRIFLILMVPCVLFMCLYSDFIFSIMVSEKYRNGTALVPYVAISVLVAGIIYKYKLGIMAMEKTQTLMYIVIAAGILNVVFNLIAIPLYGLLGAAIGTLLAYLAYLTMLIIVSKRHFPWKFPILAFIRILACAITPALLLLFLQDAKLSVPAHILSALSFPVIYVLLLFISKEITKKELSSSLALVSKFKFVL